MRTSPSSGTAVCFDASQNSTTTPLAWGAKLANQELIAALPENGFTAVSCDVAVRGCTVRDAENYNPAANIEDRSCTFGDVCTLLEDPAFLLLDTREPSIFAKSHLRGAKNVPISTIRADPESVLKVTGGRRDLPMLIQCGLLAGTWAAEVKQTLAANNFTNMVNIGGYPSITKLACPTAPRT